jgi:hypothetical protein
MKKAIVTILALMLALSLAACGSGNTGGSGGASGGMGASSKPTPVANEVIDEGVSAVSLLELTGEANIERGAEELSARAGMRLMNLDTLRTMAESAAWLLLEEDRAVELGENSALHIDRQSKGFVLTLTEGEVTARLDRQLNDGEEFTVKVGGLALSVRGTIFTAWLDGAIVTVNVERGEVAVIDSGGNELMTIGEDENISFDTNDGNAVVAAPLFDTMQFGGYDWLVLEVNAGKALLLSEYVLEYRPYEGEYTDVNLTWETCTLRAYLNGEFYNSFSADDRARIAPTRNSNKDNQWRGTPGGNDTDDYIFLLSFEEEGEDWWWINDDQYNEARRAYSLDGTASWWWLRSPGIYSDNAALVYVDGIIGLNGHNVHIDGGVRPALWLNLD